MDIRTELAIDAFRKQEQARRRLALAEQRTLEALRRLPAQEVNAYVAKTEAILLKMDGEDLHGRPLRRQEA